MKIRSNYVSNSSSSSYIIGIALIKDEHIGEVNDFVKNTKSTSIRGILEGNNEYEYVESFCYDQVCMFLTKGEKALIFSDVADIECDEEGNIIGEVDIENDYDKEINTILDNDKGWFEDIEYKIGVGYNG